MNNAGPRPRFDARQRSRKCGTLGRESGRATTPEVGDNRLVGQISMFSRAETAAMRDRTARRNYSPEAEAFRHEHKRHRSWGKAVRHARRIRELGAESIAAQAGMT